MYIEGKVSIIVPVYNAENFLNRTVDSILAQTYENWELLLADDCSTDQSRDIMSSYTDERIHCFTVKKFRTGRRKKPCAASCNGAIYRFSGCR